MYHTFLPIFVCFVPTYFLTFGLHGPVTKTRVSVTWLNDCFDSLCLSLRTWAGPSRSWRTGTSSSPGRRWSSPPSYRRTRRSYRSDHFSQLWFPQRNIPFYCCLEEFLLKKCFFLGRLTVRSKIVFSLVYAIILVAMRFCTLLPLPLSPENLLNKPNTFLIQTIWNIVFFQGFFFWKDPGWFLVFGFFVGIRGNGFFTDEVLSWNSSIIPSSYGAVLH